MVFKTVILCAFACLVQQCMAGSCYRPIKSSCGCSSGKVVINEIEEIEEISYRPVSIRSGYSGGYSDCVSIDVPSNGGALAVTSIGSIVPSGIAVATDLGLTGDLVLSGELPYLSAVAFEGQFATGGEVPVSYGCGNGCIAITEQIGGINAGAGAYGTNSGAGAYGINTGAGAYGINAGAGAYGISSINSCGCQY